MEREGSRMFHVMWREADPKSKGGEDHTEVGGLLIIKGHDDIWPWAAAKAISRFLTCHICSLY